MLLQWKCFFLFLSDTSFSLHTSYQCEIINIQKVTSIGIGCENTCKKVLDTFITFSLSNDEGGMCFELEKNVDTEKRQRGKNKEKMSILIREREREEKQRERKNVDTENRE